MDDSLPHVTDFNLRDLPDSFYEDPYPTYAALYAFDPVYEMAGGLFLMDQYYLPYANKQVETLRNQIKGKPPQTYLRPDRKWIFGQNNNKHGGQAENRNGSLMCS